MNDGIDVYPASDLAKAGVNPRSRTGKEVLVRVRRGSYAQAVPWQEARDDERYRAFVLGTVDAMRTADVMLSHASAAAVWRLPALDWPRQAHILTDRRMGSTGRIRRHVVRTLPEPVLIDGVLVTPAPRTVIDVARSEGFVAGLIAADAALRGGLCLRADLEEEVCDLQGRGVRDARLVAELADAGAESVGESLSRAGMYLAGLPQPQLQVRMTDDDGLIGWCDFGWDGTVGEFDGELKYGVTASSPGNALWNEKLREDRIRRQRQVARWTWQDSKLRTPMLTRLAEVGLVRDPKAQWRSAPDADVPAPQRRQSYFDSVGGRWPSS